MNVTHYLYPQFLVDFKVEGSSSQVLTFFGRHFPVQKNQFRKGYENLVSFFLGGGIGHGKTQLT